MSVKKGPIAAGIVSPRIAAGPSQGNPYLNSLENILPKNPNERSTNNVTTNNNILSQRQIKFG